MRKRLDDPLVDDVFRRGSALLLGAVPDARRIG
jgi:hypothetical protein